jgi:hypothetical protein
MMFGADETLTCIADVELEGAENEALCLGHKITKQFFVAGIYLRDDGYVLKIKDKPAYYPMPEEPELSEMQAGGLLPKPLPGYSIPLLDYAFGYSLWLIIGGVILFSAVKALFRRKAAPGIEPGSA